MAGNEGGGDDWMTSEAAAARLGVKPETLYAYVSRGSIRSERIPGSRRSRFFRADVERLAQRRRSGGRASGLEVIVESELTLLDRPGRLYYRGWDVAAAVAEGASFEEIASWLWTADRTAVDFTAPESMLTVGQRVAAALADQPLLDRLRAVVAAARHTDPLRDDRRPEAVAMTGRALIATLVDCIPPLSAEARPERGRSVAARLWPRLSPRRPQAASVRLLDATLVLLADHELAASTLAARVAASTWADPYLVVQAGLAALGGPLHGGASGQARELIREVDGGVAAAEAIGRRLRQGERVPGFGHRIYEEADPRAQVLLDLMAAGHKRRTRAPRGEVLRSEQAILDVMAERGLPFANIDFALASLAERHDMIDGAGEVVFSLARIVGWLAHAAEEYRHRLRFRPRAVYTGPPPA